MHIHLNRWWCHESRGVQITMTIWLVHCEGAHFSTSAVHVKHTEFCGPSSDCNLMDDWSLKIVRKSPVCCSWSFQPHRSEIHLVYVVVQSIKKRKRGCCDVGALNGVGTKISERDIYRIRIHCQFLQAACWEAGRRYLKAPSILDFKHRQMANWVHLTQMSRFGGEGVLKHARISKRAQEHIPVLNQRQWKKKSNYRGNVRPSVKVRHLSWGRCLVFLADSSGWTCKKTGEKGPALMQRHIPERQQPMVKEGLSIQ